MRWFNLITLCEVLAKFFDRNLIKQPQLMRSSPMRGFQAQINEENVTRLGDMFPIPLEIADNEEYKRIQLIGVSRQRAVSSYPIKT